MTTKVAVRPGDVQNYVVRHGVGRWTKPVVRQKKGGYIWNRMFAKSSFRDCLIENTHKSHPWCFSATGNWQLSTIHLPTTNYQPTVALQKKKDAAPAIFLFSKKNYFGPHQWLLVSLGSSTLVLEQNERWVGDFKKKVPKQPLPNLSNVGSVVVNGGRSFMATSSTKKK